MEFCFCFILHDTKFYNMLDGNRIARVFIPLFSRSQLSLQNQRSGTAMNALLRPHLGVPRRKNFLNEHVSVIRRIQSENSRRKEEACAECV